MRTEKEIAERLRKIQAEVDCWFKDMPVGTSMASTVHALIGERLLSEREVLDWVLEARRP